MYILNSIIRLLAFGLEILELLMIIRAIMSWFPTVRENKLIYYVYKITDYVIGPVRVFIMRNNLQPNIPFDISFLAAFIIVCVAERFLYILLRII